MTTPARPSADRGFTIVELLVVIGIIAVLITLVGVVVSKARGTADKFRLGAQLQAIAVGLDAYKTDFQAYPTTNIDVTAAGNVEINADGFRGARTLCKALMGQCPGSANAVKTSFDLTLANQDGKDGFGFTVPGRSGVVTVANTTTGEATGKIYGPYLNVDKFKIANVERTNGTVVNTKTYNQGDLIAGNTFDDQAVLLDANDSPILFWPCLNPQAPTSWTGVGTKTAGYAYVGLGYTTTAVPPQSTTAEPNASGATASYSRYAGTGTPMYDARDNAAWITGSVLRKLLGDTDVNGEIDLSLNEKPAVVGKYILWSAGPDKIFGPDPKGITDDVNNFQGE